MADALETFFLSQQKVIFHLNTNGAHVFHETFVMRSKKNHILNDRHSVFFLTPSCMGHLR